jgi:FdhD protein
VTSADRNPAEHPAEGAGGEERVAQVPVWIYDADGKAAAQPQWVIEEHPVTLFVNGEELVTLLCAGHHLDELAVGFCLAEGFIDRREDLREVRSDAGERRVDVFTARESALAKKLWARRTVTSGCGKGTLFYSAMDQLLSAPVESRMRIRPADVRARMQDLNRLSRTYRRTHGVHNSALATPEAVVVFRDDIGRHNAVDMLVGHAFLAGLPLDDKMLITTGRLTSEILIKAAKVGIPVLVSRNTATTLAIELAKELNITLIGYVRAGRFTVYAGNHRLGAPPE